MVGGDDAWHACRMATKCWRGSRFSNTSAAYTLGHSLRRSGLYARRRVPFDLRYALCRVLLPYSRQSVLFTLRKVMFPAGWRASRHSGSAMPGLLSVPSPA